MKFLKLRCIQYLWLTLSSLLLFIHDSISNKRTDRRILLLLGEVSLDQLLLGLQVELAQDLTQILAEASLSRSIKHIRDVLNLNTGLEGFLEARLPAKCLLLLPLDELLAVLAASSNFFHFNGGGVIRVRRNFLRRLVMF